MPAEAAPPGAQAESFHTFFQEIAAAGEDDGYIREHVERLIRTMTLVPKPSGAGRVLELGAYMQMTPALRDLCGYSEVRGAYFGEAGESVERTVNIGAEAFRCSIDVFDAERDHFPYPDDHFSLVLCCEMLEHLVTDPMHMMLEVRRVLEPGGRLLLTTPNCASFTSLTCLLHGRHNPQIYACYPRRSAADRPHVREYTAWEVGQLMAAAGFRVESLFTERRAGCDPANWVYDLLIRNQLEVTFRGEQTYCVAIVDKSAPVDRYPSWLYDTQIAAAPAVTPAHPAAPA
jgi:SAM-dependent methyltransferase